MLNDERVRRHKMAEERSKDLEVIETRISQLLENEMNVMNSCIN